MKQEEITEERLRDMSLEEVEALSKEMESDLMGFYDNSMKALVLKDLEEKERLDELIGSLKTDDFMTMDLRGIPVRIQRTLTRSQKRELMNLGKKQEEVPWEEFEQEMYRFLAEISLDAPFTRKESWEKVDKETGEILSIYMHAVEILAGEIEAMRGFRRGKGPSSRGDVNNSRRPGEPEKVEQL